MRNRVVCFNSGLKMLKMTPFQSVPESRLPVILAYLKLVPCLAFMHAVMSATSLRPQALQVPNGEITSEQLRVLGNLIKPYGDEIGVGDITTRANFQLRGIPLGDADMVAKKVQECGLSNVQTGPHSSICSEKLLSRLPLCCPHHVFEQMGGCLSALWSS